MSHDRLHALVERMSHVLQEDLRAVATRHGLALAQLEALHFLAAANRFSDTLTGMTDYLGATKGTTSQSVAALVRKGLVERVADPDDGRVQHCRLTPSGRAVVAESLPAPVLRGLPGGDLPVEALERLLRGMLGARGGRSFGVCATCAHHERSASGLRCKLIGAELDEEDASRICREHVPSAA